MVQNAVERTASSALLMLMYMKVRYFIRFLKYNNSRLHEYPVVLSQGLEDAKDKQTYDVDVAIE